MSRSLFLLLLAPLACLLISGTVHAGQVIAWITEVVDPPMLSGFDHTSVLAWFLALLGL